MDGIELVLPLVGLLVGLLVFLSPIFSLIGFLRARQLRETVAQIEDTVRALDATEVRARCDSPPILLVP